MTTNWLNKIDLTVRRPGRINYEIEFFDVTQDKAKEMFLRIIDSDSDTKKENLATVFSEKIPHLTFSKALVQQFLVKYMKNKEKAMNEANT